MTDAATFGYPEAALRLGVSISTLRRAIRAGRVPAPEASGATANLTAEWLASVEAAAKGNSGVLNRAILQKTRLSRITRARPPGANIAAGCAITMIFAPRQPFKAVGAFF